MTTKINALQLHGSCEQQKPLHDQHNLKIRNFSGMQAESYSYGYNIVGQEVTLLLRSLSLSPSVFHLYSVVSLLTSLLQVHYFFFLCSCWLELCSVWWTMDFGAKGKEGGWERRVMLINCLVVLTFSLCISGLSSLALSNSTLLSPQSLLMFKPSL